jgi:Tol biopolymer transport system component
MWQQLGRARTAVAVTAAVAVAPFALALPANATTAGSNGLIAFAHREADGDLHRRPLYTMNPDGTSIRQLTHPDWGFADLASSWSPDGTKLVFEEDDNTLNLADLYVINADGSDLDRLTDCAAEPQDSHRCGGYFGPVWLPDGNSIVFTRCCITQPDGDHQTIDIMRSDGTGLRTIAIDPSPNGGDDGVAVSPDGQWVAFSEQHSNHSFSKESGSALFVVHSNGSGLRQVTSFGLWVDEKDWSPDGSRIVFVTHQAGRGQPFRADIDTIRPDGTGLTQLSSTTPGQTYAFEPEYAPAGNRILFSYFPDSEGDSSLATMRTDGSDVQFIPGTSGDSPASWGTAPQR